MKKLENIKAFHGVEPHRQNRTGVRFFYFRNHTVRFRVAYFLGISYGAVRCGAFFFFTVRCGADFVLEESYGAERCGYPLNSCLLWCG